jgi:transcriptional regulator with XRE-family HTH domain
LVIMTQPDWQARLTARVSDAVRRFRTERGMSAQDVADACAVLGHPIPRTVISNLENGRRSGVDLSEVLVLAKVLGVPPLALLIPVGLVGSVEILPGREMSTSDALEWFSAEIPFGDDPEPDTFDARFDEVRKHAQAVRSLLKSMEMADEFRRGAALIRDPERRAGNLSWVAKLDGHVGEAVRELQDYRAEMRERGLEPPTLPEALDHLDLVETEDGYVSVHELRRDEPT